MEDEDGYTVLNLRRQEKTTTRLSPGRIQDSPLGSRRCKCMLGILGAVCIILTLAVIILIILVFQGRSLQTDTGAVSSVPKSGGVAQRNSPGRECNRSLEDLGVSPEAESVSLSPEPLSSQSILIAARRYRKAMCPTGYMDRSENGGETAKALTNPAGSQTKNRPDESHLLLFRILWKYRLVMVLFLVFQIIAVIVLAGDCGMREPFLSRLCRGSTTDTFCEQQTKEITQERKAKDFRQCPHWHQLVLKIGAAGYVILLVGVIVLSVWVFQGSSGSGLAPEGEAVSERPRNESKCVASQEKLSYLKQHLCDPPQSNSTEGSRCVLCPRDWLPYKGKCYWVSKETRMWNSSHDDCLTKSSHLLVTQDQEEMDYIQTVTSEKNSIWIGLNFKSPERTWIWVDGSPFNENLFPGAGSPGGRDCGVLKRNEIVSETCSAELKWICQKDALLI